MKCYQKLEKLLFTILVDCEWGKWKDWSKCTTSCGGGVKMRTRRPITFDKLMECSGSFIEHHLCNTRLCPGVETLQKDVATLKKLHRDVEQLSLYGEFSFKYILVF